MQKRLIILTLVVIMALISGCIYLPESPGKAYESAAKLAAEYQCTDSDSGKNLHDYGYTIELVNGQNIKNADTCAGSILYEAVCRQGEVKAIEKIDCKEYDMLCTNGACAVSASTIDEQQCMDSDDGLNMMEFGFTTEFRNGRQITNDDKCSGNILYEAVCKQSITKATERVRCQDYGLVCDNGACAQEVDEEQDAGAAEDQEAAENEEEEEDAAGGQRGAAGITSCTDPDGLNSHVLGTVTIVYRDGSQNTYRDECDPTGRYLQEQRCTVDLNNNPTFGTRSIDCQATGEVCSNGVCAAAGGGARGAAQATCTDSDNGVNAGVRGTVTITNPDGRIVAKSDGCYDEGGLGITDQGQYVADYVCNEANPGISTLMPINCEAQDKTCRNGVCVAEEGEPAPVFTCTDSDGGINFARAGAVTETINGRPTISPDLCAAGSDALFERYCGNDHRVSTMTIRCGEQGKQCVDGACAPFSPAPVFEPRILDPVLLSPRQLEPLACTDTDGNNPDIMGTLRLRDGTDYLDVCHYDNIKLTEQYCSEGNAQGTVGITRGVATIDCSQSNKVCKDGACVVRAEAQSVRLCQDNDGDNPYVFGQVNVIVGTDVRVEKDVCLDNNRLREQICGAGNVHGAKTYYCSNTGYSCKNGKCVDLRVSIVQQPLSSAGQAIQPPTIIKQYPVLTNTITIKKII